MSGYLENLFSLRGKAALVTGASGGIGRVLALALAEAGASVAAHGRNPTELQETLRQIEARRVKHMYMVPTMMNRIWQLPEEVRLKYDVSSVETILHTAAPCPPWLKEKWIDWLGPEKIWEAYGATEATGATIINGSDWLKRPGSVGRFMMGTRGRILGPDMQDQPPGEVGQLKLMIKRIEEKREDLRQKRRDLEETLAELDRAEETCVERLVELGVNT